MASPPSFSRVMEATLTSRIDIAPSPCLLWLVCRVGGIRRDLCRLRLRLYVQRLCRGAAAGFRRLARLGVAGILARRISLFRPRHPQRPPRRSCRFPRPRRRRHDSDRPRPRGRKRGAQSSGSLRRLWTRCRAWRRLRLCSRHRCGAAMVRPTPRFCLRSRGERHRRRYAGDAATGLAPDREFWDGGAPISRSALSLPSSVEGSRS